MGCLATIAKKHIGKVHRNSGIEKGQSKIKHLKKGQKQQVTDIQRTSRNGLMRF